MGTYLERGLSAYSVTICDMGYKSRWAYPYMFYMFRAAQSVGTSTCMTIKTNNSHNADNADIFGCSFDMTCYYQSIVNINI